MVHLLWRWGLMSEKQIKLFLDWVIAYIILPILPFAIRVSISIFSKIEVDLYDSVELLLFNFIICISWLDNKIKRITYKYIVQFVVYLIIIIDLIILFLIYAKLEKNVICNWYITISALLIAAVSAIYKYFEIASKKVKGA